jgi:Spx/MgsR family transcriptional regulator
MTVYGIKNCDTVKKAVTWLKENDVAFDFHDYKSKGIDEKKLKEWSAQVGWESLVNKKGTTWRQLDDDVKEKVVNESSAIALMKEKTSVIKRPLLEKNGKVVALGFDEATYSKNLVK